MNTHAIDLSVLLIAVLVVIGKVIVPIGRAYARRIEGGTADPGDHGGFEELRGRVTALEIREARVLELEERPDFAERLLAQARDRQLNDGDPQPETAPATRQGASPGIFHASSDG